MAEADLKVGFVVGRRHFEDASAELEIHMVIANDRDQALFTRSFQRQGLHDHLADEMRVARVFGIHGHGGIRRDRFRAGGGDGEERAGRVGEFDFEMIHEAILRLHFHLFIRQRREAGRTPVHHAFATINQPLLVKVHEDSLHATRVIFIHRKTRPFPVTRASQRSELFQNDPAILLFPFPDFLHQLLPA